MRSSSRIILIIFIFSFFGCESFLASKPASAPAISSEQVISYEKNSSQWQRRNKHLIADKAESMIILSLDQVRDFASDDIDGDGVRNTLDPSPYDWREIGYQPFGVLAFLPWRHDWNKFKYSKEDLEKSAQLLKEAGVAFVRMDFLWEDIESVKGNFDFAKYDFIVEALFEANIHIVGILGYSASWAGASWNAPPDDIADFVNYLSRVVSRYKEKVKYWEIWNEPDSRTYWQAQDGMEAYTKLLQLSYMAAKEIDPSCKIVLGGMTSNGYYALKSIYRNGGKGYFDIINIHPFVSPLKRAEYKRIKNIYDNLEELKAQYGDKGKKIWFTEIGCPGLKSPKEGKGWWEGKSPSEKQQAQFLSHIYTRVIQLPNVEKVFWAFFRDNKDHFGDDVDYFGLIRWDFSKKPAYEMYQKKFLRWQKQYK